MKLVIKDNKVLATHDNNQDIENKYEDCFFVIDDSFLGEIGYDYEITQEQLNSIQKTKLQTQIDELDKKRIRAVCEPSIKDETIGQTWLEFYTLQIQNLREQISEL